MWFCVGCRAVLPYSCLGDGEMELWRVRMVSCALLWAVLAAEGEGEMAKPSLSLQILRIQFRHGVNCSRAVRVLSSRLIVADGYFIYSFPCLDLHT